MSTSFLNCSPLMDDMLTFREQHPIPEEEYDAEWRKKYGDEAAKLIRQTVDRNMEDYLYMKQFTVKA